MNKETVNISCFQRQFLVTRRMTLHGPRVNLSAMCLTDNPIPHAGFSYNVLSICSLGLFCALLGNLPLEGSTFLVHLLDGVLYFLAFGDDFLVLVIQFQCRASVLNRIMTS